MVVADGEDGNHGDAGRHGDRAGQSTGLRAGRHVDGRRIGCQHDFGAGAPTLDGLGPVGGNAHAPSEYMELNSIVPRTTLLAALLLSVSRQPSMRAKDAR